MYISPWGAPSVSYLIDIVDVFESWSTEILCTIVQWQHDTMRIDEKFGLAWMIIIQSNPFISRLLGAKIREHELSGSLVI